MAEALAMLSESRSIEGARLTLLSRLKQHSIYIARSSFLAYQFYAYLLNEAFFPKHSRVSFTLCWCRNFSVWSTTEAWSVVSLSWFQKNSHNIIYRQTNRVTVTLAAHARRGLTRSGHYYTSDPEEVGTGSKTWSNIADLAASKLFGMSKMLICSYCKDDFSVLEHFHLKLRRNQKDIVR